VFSETTAVIATPIPSFIFAVTSVIPSFSLANILALRLTLYYNRFPIVFLSVIGVLLSSSGSEVSTFPTFLIPKIQRMAIATQKPDTIQYKYFNSLKYDCNFNKTRDANMAPRPLTTAAYN
jgi:hypothetical protein